MPQERFIDQRRSAGIFMSPRGLLFRDNGHGPALQKGIDQCAIYLQAAVVLDEAFLLERTHKFTDPCAGGTNHLRQSSLAHFQGVLRLGFLGYFPKQQQNSCQPLFAEIEELIGQVFLDSNHSGKQIRIQQRRKLRVALELAKRAVLLQASDIGGPNRSRRVHPQRLPSQTAFAKKATPQQDGDDRFFATRSGHRELHRTALDIENRIGFVPLRKNDLVVPVAPHSHRRTELFAENCGTETGSLIRHPSPWHDQFTWESSVLWEHRPLRKNK